MRPTPLYLSLLLTVILVFSCKKDKDVPPPVEPQPKVPALTTFEVSNLTRYSVDMNGQVTDTGASGISEAGFVVDTVPTPTITKNLNKFIRPVQSNGNLKVTVIGIPPSKKYYIRAFATNKEGTGYGNEVSFVAKDEKVYQGHVVLSSQQQVIDFGAQQYTTIDGTLEITGTVTDLSPLKHLAVINYALNVINTTALKNLKGMDSLEVVNSMYFYHGMRIDNNSALTSLEGLEKLRGNNGILYIVNNDALTDLHGLDNITYSHFGELRVDGCDNLRSLHGLEKLTWLDGELMLIDNKNLTDISALSNLSFISRRIQVYNNASLSNLAGLEKIHNVEAVELVNNFSLKDIKGLSNLDTITGLLLLQNNNVLNDLSPFGKIKTVPYLTIKNSPAITSLTGFSSLESVTDDLKLDNTGLTDLRGLERMTKARKFSIYNNEQLISLQGLDNLTSITGSAYPLTIARNNKLKTLAGLEKLTDVESSPQISYNPQLSDFCALRALFATGWNNDFLVDGNAINPTGADILRDCKP